MRRQSLLRLLVGVAFVAAAVFVVLTVIVTSNPSLAFDSSAFETADDLRAAWLDKVARVVTTLGLIAVVGSAVVLGGWLLVRRGQRLRAGALVAGAALAWSGVWITKVVVDRPRPPVPLVHTSGASYPSAHAANSVGWFALAVALAVLIPRRGVRVLAVVVGALLTVLVGLSRIYLRAHYATDVIAGEAFAVAAYALCALGALAWPARRSYLSSVRRE